MDLLFKTIDQRGLGVSNLALYDNAAFFDSTLSSEHSISSVFVHTTAYDFSSQKRLRLAEFAKLAKEFGYRPFVYAGNPNWAKQNPWKIDEMIQTVLRFNKYYDEAPFAGVLLDIQPCVITDNPFALQVTVDSYIKLLHETYHNVRIYNSVRETNFQVMAVLPRELYKLDESTNTLQRFQNSCHSVIDINYVD